MELQTHASQWKGLFHISVSMSFSNFPLSRPDKNKDCAGWNASWERELRELYAAMELRNSGESWDTNNYTQFTPLMLPSEAIYAERETHAICELQEDLVSMALERMTIDNFEKKWKALAQKDREALVLEGLWKASSAGPDMECHRIYCPEMTVENLAGNDGQTYLDLLMKLVPDDIGGRITEPTLIANEVLDRFYTKSRESSEESTKVMPLMMQRGRAYFMDMTLWCILFAFVSTIFNPRP